jgi:hypothetical protein
MGPPEPAALPLLLPGVEGPNSREWARGAVVSPSE